MSDVIEVVDLETMKIRKVHGNLKAEEVKQKFHNKEFDSMETPKKASRNHEEIIPAAAKAVTKPKSKKWSLFHKEEEEQKETVTEGQETQKEVSEEKQVIEERMVREYEFDIKDDFRNDIEVAYDIIYALESIKKTDNIVKNLQISITMIEAIARYADKDLPKDSVKHGYLTMSNIITYMINETYKSMRDAYAEIKDKVIGIDGQLLEKFKTEILKYMHGSNRIVAVIEESKHSDKYRTWNDIFEETMKENIVDLTDMHTDITGNVMSTVTVIGEGEEQTFFKEDTKVVSKKDSFRVSVEKYITEDKSPRVKNYFLIEQSRTDYRMLLDEYFIKCKKNRKLLFRDFMCQSEFLVKKNNLELMDAIVNVFDNTYKLSNIRFNAEDIGILPGEEFTGRNIAVTKMAQLFGMEGIVVSNQTATLVSGEHKSHGFVMSKAQGTDYSGINKSYIDTIHSYTGEFQRQMVMLQLFDNIMGQKDRHLNNIFYNTEINDVDGVKKTVYTGITGIDNDMCCGAIASINHNFGHEVAILDYQCRHLAFDCMDKQMYEHMKVIDDDMIRTTLKGLVGSTYIEALIQRFNIIRNAIENTIRDSKRKVLFDKDEWGNETIGRLINNKNLVTNYVHRFMRARAQSGKFHK